MTATVFPLPQVPVIPVMGESGAYPVRRIFCVGRNYVAHAEEMGVAVDRAKPFYFSKSAFHFQATGGTIPYAAGSDNFHYEMEVAIAIGAPAFKVTADAAMDAVASIMGIPPNRRSNYILYLQQQVVGNPWG